MQGRMDTSFTFTSQAHMDYNLNVRGETIGGTGSTFPICVVLVFLLVNLGGL